MIHGWSDSSNSAAAGITLPWRPQFIFYLLGEGGVLFDQQRWQTHILQPPATRALRAFLRQPDIFQKHARPSYASLAALLAPTHDDEMITTTLAAFKNIGIVSTLQ